MAFRIDDNVGATLVRVASEALERDRIDQQGWEDRCCNIVADAWKPIATCAWSDRKDVTIRCRKKVYIGAAKGRVDDVDVVGGAGSTPGLTPLAVFEAKRWGDAPLVAPDVKKLLTITSRQEATDRSQPDLEGPPLPSRFSRASNGHRFLSEVDALS